MKTQITVKIKSETQNLQFGYWDMESESFIPIDNMNDDERKQAAELLGCSPVLLDALQMLVETICDVVDGDLCDIWRRLDAAEIK